jgi:hypothetical protein
MADRSPLRLSALLLFAGLFLTFLVGIFHADPARESANNHLAAFAAYAASGVWTAVHLGQFTAMVVVVLGLLVLFFALDLRAGGPLWVGRAGAAAAVVALALYGVLQAVDGVALKQAVDAWASAPEAEKAARFASAEAIRWIEWGVRSYQSFVLGLAFLLFAAAIVWTGKVSRPVGYLMGATGLAYLAQGWVIGSEGFSASNTAPTLIGYFTWLAWAAWFLVGTLRAREAPPGARAG